VVSQIQCWAHPYFKSIIDKLMSIKFEYTVNRYISKNIDQWLVTLKKCDISGPMFIDLKKIYTAL
jgi:hypothetical protein